MEWLEKNVRSDLRQASTSHIDGKVYNYYKVAVRPAMLYGLETVALTKRQEAEMEVAELKMLWFSLGVTRMNKVRNECIRGMADVGRYGEKTWEARLRWFGHVRRKDYGYIRKEETEGLEVHGCGGRGHVSCWSDGGGCRISDDGTKWRLKICCDGSSRKYEQAIVHSSLPVGSVSSRAGRCGTLLRCRTGLAAPVLPPCSPMSSKTRISDSVAAAAAWSAVRQTPAPPAGPDLALACRHRAWRSAGAAMTRGPAEARWQHWRVVCCSVVVPRSVRCPVVVERWWAYAAASSRHSDLEQHGDGEHWWTQIPARNSTSTVDSVYTCQKQRVCRTFSWRTQGHTL